MILEGFERELREELDVAVEAKKEVSKFEHEYPFALIKLTLIMCHLKTDNEKMTLDGSHLAVRWIDIHEKTLTFAPLDQKIFEFVTRESNLGCLK